MLVTHLILKNWRNFRSVDVDLSDRVFLVGPNASGKSNLLDVFRFLRDLSKDGGGLQKAISDRGGVSKVRCLAARRHPEIEIDVTLSAGLGARPLWRYAIGIEQQPRGHHLPILKYEHVWQEGTLILARPDDKDRADPERLTQTHLEQVNDNRPFRDIAKFFVEVLYLHLVPQLVKNAMALQGPGMAYDPFGRSFLDRVWTAPKKTRESRLNRIQEALTLAVPQFKELKMVQDEKGTPHLEAIYTHWRGTGARQREDQFSDGTLRLIGLLWSLMEGESLLLLEEPELSLNAGIVRKLAPMIYRMQRARKRQVIVSTHSADLLSDGGIGTDEVLLLRPGAEGTHVDLLSARGDVVNLLEAGMSVADVTFPEIVPQDLYQLDLYS